MERDLEIKDVKGFIKRRRKAFVITFFTILICGFVLAIALPPIYKSEGTIRLQNQQIPEDFVKQPVKEFAVERIEKISQQVLSRPKLIEIINSFDLYQDIRGDKSDTELVNKLRGNIALETITADLTSTKGHTSFVTVAFNISFQGKEPETVKNVTEKLSNLYLEEDVKNRKKMVAGTTNFFENEIKRLKEEIDLQEKKISQFKKKHLRELPSDQSYNLQTVARFERELDQTDMSIRVLQERKLLLEAQLASVKPLTPIVVEGKNVTANPSERLKELRLQLTQLRSAYSDRHPDIKQLKREISKLENEVKQSDESVGKIKRLNQLETQRASATSQLGPNHPDVRAIDKEIKSLQNEIENRMTETAKVSISEEQPDNPVYINLKTQIETVQMEIIALQKEKEKIKDEVNTYQRRIESSPGIEKELNALYRDYENSKNRYAELSNKLMNAKVVEEMEGTQKGQRFSITSPAYLPQKPSKPNRSAILLLSFLIALGLSSALVVAQESVDDSIKTSSNLKELTGVPVLASVSYLVTDQEKRSSRFKRLSWTFITICILGAALYCVDKYFIKLELLWTFILNRLQMIA
ncbi:MAG: GumC family protein [Planctomycetota bacterium]|jgi:uncharacterized protein involved in exopolysaccharide biosynthesis